MATILGSCLKFYNKKAPPRDIEIKTWSGPHRPRSFSVPLTAFVVDNQMSLKDNVYMSSRTVCHKEFNWSAVTTRNIFMHLLQVLPDSNGEDLKITQRANLGLKSINFGIVYEKCTINFDQYSLVLIIFNLVFVKSNMISNIKLIVTNIQMWKDLGLSGPGWPFVWG